MIEVGEPVDIAACHPARTVLPCILVVGGDAEATLQAVALVQRNVRAEGIGEVVKIDIGIGQLCLWRDRPVLVDDDPLAGFEAQRVAETVIAVCQALAECIGGNIAVVPVELCLPIDIEPVLAKPGQRAAKTVAVGSMEPLPKMEETSVEISPYWNVTPPISVPDWFS